MKIHTFLRKKPVRGTVLEIFVSDKNNQDDFYFKEVIGFFNHLKDIKGLEVQDLSTTEYEGSELGWRVSFFDKNV